MTKIMFALLVAVCATASAEVFRQIGPNGEVFFTDTPAPGAEQMELSPLQTIESPAPPRLSSGKDQSGEKAADRKRPVPAYTQFAIVSPSNGDSLRANDGRVTVSLSVQPALAPGDTIELILNGAMARSGATLTFELGGVARGEHTLVARLKNGNGKKLIDTAPVSFHVLRVALGG